MKEHNKTDLWIAGLVVWMAALIGFTAYAVRFLGFFSKALVTAFVIIALIIYILMVVRFSRERKQQYEEWRRGQ
jgi:positive regulator of sigma E activity